MAKLSYVADLINKYIKAYGNKDITSIKTPVGGSSGLEYIFCLHDIYDGPVGTNLFTGEDTISIYEDGKAGSRGLESVTVSQSEQINKQAVMEAYSRLGQRLKEDEEKPLHTRMAVFWGALMLMRDTGLIGQDEVCRDWNEFTFSILDLAEQTVQHAL